MTHKSDENSSFECLISLLREEDISWSLDVLYGGLGIIKLQFLSKIYFLSAVILLSFRGYSGYNEVGGGGGRT